MDDTAAMSLALRVLTAVIRGESPDAQDLEQLGQVGPPGCAQLAADDQSRVVIEAAQRRAAARGDEEKTS